MLIMLLTSWIASLHQAHVIFWDDHLYVGLQRSRNVYLSPLLNLNTLLLDLAALSFGMKQTLKDYGIHLKQVPLYCDNESAIKIANNLVQHSKTKHIQIRHHFLIDHAMKEDIDIIQVNIEEKLVDIFTKPLDEKRFFKLRCALNILESSNVL